MLKQIGFKVAILKGVKKMHIALAFNVREEMTVDDDQPPSCSFDEPPGHTDDLYAEWDDAATIQAVADALASQHQVSLVNADLNAFETFRRLKPDLVFNIAEGLYGASREAQIPAMLEMLQIPYTGSDASLRPPNNRLTTERVPIIAVNIDVRMPIISVIANPLIGPVPNASNTTAAISVVILASAIDDSAFS